MGSQESFAFVSGTSELLPIPMRCLKEMGKSPDTSLNQKKSLTIKGSSDNNNDIPITETNKFQNETKDISKEPLIINDKKTNTELNTSNSNRLRNASGNSSNDEEDEDENEESNADSCNAFSELSSPTSTSANSSTVEKQNPIKLDLPPHYTDLSTDTSSTEEKLPSYSPSLNHLSINFLCHEIKSNSNMELLKIGVEPSSDYFIPVICEINSTQINFYKLQESTQSIKHDNYYQYSSYFFERLSKNMIDPNLNIKQKSSTHNIQHHQHPHLDNNSHYQSEIISFSNESSIHSVYNLLHRSDTPSNLSVNDTRSTISKSSSSSILSFGKKKTNNNSSISMNHQIPLIHSAQDLDHPQSYH
ncbi:unnamed protein product [[Candida] boidinii]|nr:unnamed protein product [[Candida] boidinii]